MFLTVILLILSLGILYFGADFLVKGSSSLALRAGIPSLIVGLTVVSLGTSSPELVVSLKAALSGQPEIAAGNVIGSNIFNIGVILGISSLIAPLCITRSLIRQDMPFLLFGAVLLPFFFMDGKITRVESGIFCAGAIAYTLLLIRNARKAKKADKDQTSKNETKSGPAKHWAIDVFFVVIGLAMLIGGSNLLVDNAVKIARIFGMSEAIIGLTIVAAGTGTPELATSIVATIKGNKDIAIGNVVGSNIYNILLVLGVSSMIRPISTTGISTVDTYILLGFSILLLPLMRTGYELKRWEGGLMLSLYIAYILYLTGVI
ncbi:MAG: calcium/sodium antiporter [Bacteroidales bacterium]